jgi:tetratricopeptide (TPR) repeat protein
MGDPQRLRATHSKRRCHGCGAVLAADNTARLCGKCHRDQRDSLQTPPAHLRDEFFETDDFLSAFESQHIGRVFKAYRNHPRHLLLFGKALNQELLGRWLGLTQAQVSKLENGKPEQNLDALRNHAKILHLPQHLLWFDLPGQSRLSTLPEVVRGQAPTVGKAPGPVDHDTDEISTAVERVQLPEAGSIGSATLDMLSNSVEEAIGRPAPRLAFGDVMGSELAELDVALKPVGVSEAMLDRFERTVCFIHTHFATVAPAQLLPVVNDHIRAVTRLLGVGQPITYRRRLCSIAGHLAGQRAWLMFDLCRTAEAETWYEFALEPASEAGDDSLAAWLLGAHSVVAFDRGDPRQAKQLLDRAHYHVGRAGSTPVNGWVDALRSRAHAALGEVAAAREALVRAQNSPLRVADDIYRHGMDTSGGELRIDYYEGSTLLAVGDLVGAREAFERALEAQGPGHLKGRAVVNLHIAMTYAQHDVDRAVDLATSAWAIPAEQRIGPIGERVHQLRRMMSAAAGSSALQHFDQLLAASPSQSLLP